MQHAIGEHALLADGRSAALVDPDGNVAWLCMPRVDTPPVLLSLLDEDRGGIFAVRPASASARVVSRRYHPSSLVLETVWELDGAQLIVDDALTLREGALVRRVVASGGDVEVRCAFMAAFDMGRGRTAMRLGGNACVATASGETVSVHAPAAWESGAPVSCCFTVTPGAPAAVALVYGDRAGAASTDASRLIDDTLAAWQDRVPGADSLRISQPVASVIGGTRASELAAQSIAVLIGLRQRNGAIVAAPTADLPQWPGTSRTWDYRYCWLRDAALAGRALLRAGMYGEAVSIGAFIGNAVQANGPRPVVRVDGTKPPPETVRPELGGYRGARPARVGNAASGQVQMDVPGEVIELAADLADAHGLPPSLAAAATTLADWAAAHWTDPDHGVWEIRGEPRAYSHSRVMAVVGLERAAAMASRGVISPGTSDWRGEGRVIRDSVLGSSPAALELHGDGGGADAALAEITLSGFLPAGDPRAQRTLDLITQRLDRNGLIDRHEPSADASADPCGPFIFATFWLAGALAASGRDPSRHIAAAVSAAGSLGLWGEVADPRDMTPWGNYPQVQSHAAYLMLAMRADASRRS